MSSDGKHFSVVPQAHSNQACHSKVPSGFSAAVRNACQTQTLSTQIFGAKVIVLGDSAVGKTSLIRRFVSRTFERTYKATIGVDFDVQKFFFLGKQFDLRIWDTAGNERFKTITSAYYRGSNAIILVYDASKSTETLNDTKQWLEEAMEKQPDDGCFVFLVASKKDLLTQVGVEHMEKDGIAMAQELGAEFWSVSSKSGENVPDLFTRVAALCFDTAVSAAVKDTVDGSTSTIGQVGTEGNLIRLQKSSSVQASVASSTTGSTSCCKPS